MKRYFVEIAYDGSNFSGWQKQDNALTIQGLIESVLSQLYNHPVDVVGCGRTDAGVHASQYFLHVDLNPSLFNEVDLKFKLNNMLGTEIVVKNIIEVEPEAHARFDASARSYSYYINFEKDPFKRNFRYLFHQREKLDLVLLDKASKLLLNYNSFYPFCKSNSDVTNYDCKIYRSEWSLNDDLLVYHIKANRFLRGMVRLIVGMCINVSLKKLEITDVVDAMDKQERLALSWSAPAQALFLDRIEYPYINQ